MDTGTHLGGSNRKVFAEKEKIDTHTHTNYFKKEEEKTNRKTVNFV